MVGKNTIAKKVHFCFLIFSPQKSPFASYGGGFNEKNFDGTKVYDINKIMYPSPYVFYGFMGLRYTGKSPLGFSSDVDENLLMKISNNRNFDEITISYIVLGVPTIKSCASCPGKFVSKDACLNSCPAGSYPFKYKDNGQGCRTCSSHYNFEVNSQRNGCTCKAGY